MQKLYNNLAYLYDTLVSYSVKTKKEAAFVHSLFKPKGVSSILDIACGTGRHSIALGKYGYAVTGVDYSKYIISVARKKLRKYSDLKVNFSVQDVSKMKFKRKFDSAICMWSTFGELPYRKMLTRLKSVLKKNGLFLIEVHYYNTIPRKKQPIIRKNYHYGNKDITMTIRNKFEGRKRIRFVHYIIDGKSITDRNETDIYTPSELITLIEKAGYTYLSTFYDYIQKKKEHPQRVQLLFKKG